MARNSEGDMPPLRGLRAISPPNPPPTRSPQPTTTHTHQQAGAMPLPYTHIYNKGGGCASSSHAQGAHMARNSGGDARHLPSQPNPPPRSPQPPLPTTSKQAQCRYTIHTYITKEEAV